MARRAPYQTKYHSKASIYLVCGTLFVFAFVLFVNCRSLTEKKERLQEEQASYQEMLKEEQQEALELEELEKTTQTMKYYEKVARERLGMVYEGEIVFKEGN